MTMDEVIAAAKRGRVVPVETPFGRVHIRSLSEAARARWEMTTLDRATGDVDYSKLPDSRALLVALSLVDEDGTEVFGADHVDEVKTLDAAFTAAIFSAALDVQGFEGAEIEELVGN